ncbi:MAG: phosphate uptake regulator PhoU [Candidatus Bathyarchaeota archaeon]
MEKDLGFRRVQNTGRGSYIISLPKEWVQNMELKRGSEVSFKMQDDLALVLTPEKMIDEKRENEPKLKEYWILVEQGDDPQSLYRKITALYVVSADLIHIHFKDGNSSKYKAMINNLAKNMLLGLEIIDETPDEVTLQILVNQSELPVEKAIRRMAALTLSANKDAISLLQDKSDNLIQSVTDTYQDVNRLNMYVVRQLKFGLEKNLFRELGFRSPKEFLGYRIVVNDLKSIASNALNIVNNVVALGKLVEKQALYLKEPADKEIYSQILNFNSLAHQLFEEALKAMFKRSYEQADAIISKLESYVTLENDLITIMVSKRLDPNLSLVFRLALDSARRVAEYSRDVAEVTLNRTIEEISSVSAL